ncbi:MAG: AI-2E family transporter [Roseiflexaceae bacterium]|jgi:predicted PurR-regulated permease PerM
MQIPPATIRFSPTLKWVAVVLVCVGVYVLYAAVHDVALVFFGAVVVAYIFYPVISWITPYTRGSRMLATTVFHIVVAIMLVVAVSWLWPPISTQYALLRQDMPRILTQIQADPVTVAGMTVDVSGELQKLLSNVIASLPTRVPKLLVGLIEGFLHLLAFVITSFYLLSNGRRIMSQLFQLVPLTHRAEVRFVVLQIHQILSGYIRGTLLLIPIMAVLTSVSLWLLGVEYALLIGIISGVVEILPIIGPWSAAGFAIIMAVFQQPLPISDSVVVVVSVIGALYFSLRMFEDYVIIPAVVGPAVHLHPILVIAAILAGAAVGGILGLFLAIPVTSVLQYMLRWLYHKLADSDDLPAMPHQ